MSDRPATREAILVLHGLGGDPSEIQPLVDALVRQGRKTVAPTLPGHGEPGFWMPPSRWEDWHAKVLEEYDRLRHEGFRVSVAGFSTGATLALHLASEREVERLVLLSPFMEIKSPFRWLKIEPLVRSFHRIVRQVPRRPPTLRDREARSKFVQRGSRTFSLAATKSALDLIERVKTEARSIDRPALVITSTKDTVVDSSAACWLYETLGSHDKKLVVINDSDHLVLYDHDREQVLAEALAFLSASTI